MENKKREFSPVRQYAIENEKNTNKLVVITTFAFIILSVFLEIGIAVDYSYGVELVNHYVVIPMCFVIAILDGIAFLFKFEKPWIKYILMGEISLLCFISYGIYTDCVTYLIIIPIFLSIRYFNKKFIILISTETFLLFLLATYLNYSLNSTSEIVQLFHRLAAYNSWNRMIDVFFYILVPISIVTAFAVYYAVSVTKTGQEMLKAESEFASQIASAKAELKTASIIQQSAIPGDFFLSPEGNFEAAATEISAREVGGDFYDYFMVGEDNMCFLVADVSDKGVPAAMFMMSAKKAIQCAMECCETLEEAITLANRLICRDNNSGMFLTLWLGVINTKTGIGKYVNAGHMCPALRHADGGLTWIENDPDLFLGNFPEENPRVNMFSMKAGDTLFIFTDGATDATNTSGEFFGTKKLEAAIREYDEIKDNAQVADNALLGSEPGDGLLGSESGDARACKDYVMSRVQNFIGSAEQFDDITLMALHCNHIDDFATSALEVEAGYDGNERIIDEIDRVVGGFRKSTEACRKLKVIVDEVCTNIFEYGYSGGHEVMKVNITAGANFAVLEFISGGESFDPTEVDDPEFTDEPKYGGLGIYFMKKLADEVTYEYKDGANVLKVKVIWNM